MTPQRIFPSMAQLLLHQITSPKYVLSSSYLRDYITYNVKLSENCEAQKTMLKDVEGMDIYYASLLLATFSFHNQSQSFSH